MEALEAELNMHEARNDRISSKLIVAKIRECLVSKMTVKSGTPIIHENTKYRLSSATRNEDGNVFDTDFNFAIVTEFTRIDSLLNENNFVSDCERYLVQCKNLTECGGHATILNMKSITEWKLTENRSRGRLRKRIVYMEVDLKTMGVRN